MLWAVEAAPTASVPQSRGPPRRSARPRRPGDVRPPVSRCSAPGPEVDRTDPSGAGPQRPPAPTPPPRRTRASAALRIAGRVAQREPEGRAKRVEWDRGSRRGSPKTAAWIRETETPPRRPGPERPNGKREQKSDLEQNRERARSLVEQRILVDAEEGHERPRKPDRVHAILQVFAECPRESLPCTLPDARKKVDDTEQNPGVAKRKRIGPIGLRSPNSQ